MATEEFQRLLDIMRRLRGEGGCPWDRVQTHKSLRQYILEEAYEVIEAIDAEDPQGLKEELGDLLLQIVFQAQIAEEEGLFTMAEIIRTINEKLIQRHPHVFEEPKDISADQQAEKWERMKVQQGRASALDGVPKTLPALLRAYRIQDKASRVGFDWKNPDEVWPKVEEELKELRESIKSSNKDKIEEEFGDLLFSLVNLSRFIGVNPEDSLRRTINKFIRRFQKVEAELKARGKRPEDATLKEMDEIWERTK